MAWFFSGAGNNRSGCDFFDFLRLVLHFVGLLSLHFCTLLCFYRHTAHENPYIHVGEQDITTHVNFSELVAAAEDEGLRTFGPVSQGSFLHVLGAQSLVEASRAEMAEYFARRRALEQLTDSAGLGRVRVLAATRKLDITPPGFEEAL